MMFVTTETKLLMITEYVPAWVTIKLALVALSMAIPSRSHWHAGTGNQLVAGICNKWLPPSTMRQCFAILGMLGATPIVPVILRVSVPFPCKAETTAV